MGDQRPPRFSVAMCTYNGERYIAQMLTSILNQTLPPVEIVIFDDRSDDQTLAIVREFAAAADGKIRLLEGSSRLGVTQSFARVMAECTGNFIALADQDDVWEPTKLARFSDCIGANAQAEPRLYYSDMQLMDEAGLAESRTFQQERGAEGNANIDWRYFATRNCIPGCCMVFDARALDLLLPIPGAAIMHDWWIALAFTLVGGVERIPGPPAMSYRIHAGNVLGIKTPRKVFDRLRGRNPIVVGIDNLAAVFRQCIALKERLDDRGRPLPGEFADFVTGVSASRLRRLRAISGAGISRGSAFANLPLYLLAGLVDQARLLDDAVRFR